MPPPTPPPGFTLDSTNGAPAPPPGFRLDARPPTPPPGFALDAPVAGKAPAPPPGFTLDPPAAQPWIQVPEDPPIEVGLGDSLMQTAGEWGDVIGGLPEKVSASLAKTVASMNASTFADLEQANAAAAKLGPDDWRRALLGNGVSGSPEDAARLEELTQGELAIAGEASADLQPTEGATMAQRALESAAISGPPSAVAMAAGLLTRNPAAAAATMFPTTAAQGFGDLMGAYDAQAEQQERETLKPRTAESRLADIERAQHHGNVQGTLEALTELLPMGSLLKRGTPAVQRLAEVLLAELPGETIATLTQAIDEQLAMQPEGEAELDAVFAGLEEGGKQIPETLVATILGSAGQTAPIAAAEALASRSRTAQAPPRVEPTIGEPEAAPVDVDVEAQQARAFGDELEGVVAPKAPEPAAAPAARKPSEAWTGDLDAGEGVPFAFLGEDPETAAGYLVEEAGKVRAITAAGDVVGEFDGPDAAAIALEDAIGAVQTSAPAPAAPAQPTQGLGDELAKTQQTGPEIPVNESRVPSFGDELNPPAATAEQGLTPPAAPKSTVYPPNLHSGAADSFQPTDEDRAHAFVDSLNPVTPGARASLEAKLQRPDNDVDRAYRAASAGELPERRTNRTAPKRVADMSPEELRQTILTHELTGIPNRRAYNEAPKLPSQTAVDVDSLKWVNDNMGHDSGNELLKAVGEAIRAETDDAYHLSGDEFAVQAHTDEQAAELMQRVNDRLAGAVISVTMPDGEVVTVSGLGVSYGSGKDLSTADARLQANKTERQARGERAGRGLAPPGASRFATEEGREGDEGDAPTQEGLGDAAAAQDDETGEHVTLAGPFAHHERANTEDVELADDAPGQPPKFLEFARKRWGEKWAIARNTEANRERYGRLITQAEYNKAKEEWKAAGGVDLAGGPRNKPSTTTQNLEVAVQRMLGGAKNAPSYRFVPEDGLPADVQERMRLSPGFSWKAAFDPTTSKVWLNSSEIETERDAAWYSMHEIAGHYGIKGSIGQLGAKDRSRINAALNMAGQNPFIDRLAAAYQQGRNLSANQAIEEALSELAAGIRTGDFARIERTYGLKVPGALKGEKKTEAKAAWRRAFDRFVENLKRIFNKALGFNVTDEQILDFLEGAWRYVQTGKKRTTGERSRGDAEISLSDEVEKNGKDVEAILNADTTPARKEFEALIERTLELIRTIDADTVAPAYKQMGPLLRESAVKQFEELEAKYADQFGEEYESPDMPVLEKPKAPPDPNDPVYAIVLRAKRGGGVTSIGKTVLNEGPWSVHDEAKAFLEAEVDKKLRPHVQMMRRSEYEAAIVKQHKTEQELLDDDDPRAPHERDEPPDLAEKLSADAVNRFAEGIKIQYDLEEFWLVLERNGDVELGAFSVEPGDRKQGLGTKVMRKLTDWADTHGVRLVLTPAQPTDGWGTTSRARLERFYKRFGFTKNHGRKADYSISQGMYRDPLPRIGHDDDVDLAEVFHGSHMHFERFSLEHVNRGQGAQAYGWGLYFAEAPGVANSYKLGGDRSAQLKAFTKEQNDTMPAWIRDRVGANGEGEAKLIKIQFEGRVEESLRLMTSSLQPWTYEQQHLRQKEILELLDVLIKAGDYSYTRNEGAFYKVEIDDAAIANMLDHDRKLSAQPAAVIARLKKLEKALGTEFDWDRRGVSLYTGIGNLANNTVSRGIRSEYDRADTVNAAIRRELGEEYSSNFDQNTSKLLAKYGIPGLRFLDQQSRGVTAIYEEQVNRHGSREKALKYWMDRYEQIENKLVEGSASAAAEHINALSQEGGGGTRNIVVFDDTIVTIKELNGKKIAPAEGDGIVGRSSGTDEESDAIDLAEEPKKPKKPKLELDGAPREEKRDRRRQSADVKNNAQRELALEAAQRDLDEQINPHTTETSAFKRWFGKSKVVDEKGRPLVVYHGTKASTDFKAFEESRDVGFHFGTPKAAADILHFERSKRPLPKNARIIPVYLSIQKPLRMHDLSEWSTYEVADELALLGVIDEKKRAQLRHEAYYGVAAGDMAQITNKEFRALLEAKGYDGVVYKNQTEGIELKQFDFTIDDVEIRGPNHKLSTPWEAFRPDGKRLIGSSTEEGLEERLKDLFEHGDTVETDSWIALRPSQIKSAIGNRGTFSDEAEEIDLASGPPKKGKGGGVQKISWQPGKRYVEMYRSKGSPTAPTRATVRAEELEIPKEPIRAQHVLELFQRLFKFKLYEGKPFALRGALGYFRPSNFEIRNKDRNDLEVAAHEVFHWLDRTYPTLRKLYHLRRYADELKGVSYDETKIFEGFAEFGRLFMTQEPEAIERLPTFYEAFVKETRDIGILDKLEEVQRLMHQWYLQGAEARGRSKIGTSKAPIRQRLGKMADGFIDRALASSLDARHAAKVIERETRGAIHDDAAMSPYKSIRLLGGARSTINTFLNYSTLKWSERGDLERNGVGLRQIFEPIAGVFDEAMGYFVALRADELRVHSKENLLRKDETRALIARAEKTGKLEQIKRAHEQYQQYTKRLTAFAVQSGILSAETKAMWEELYANYVPFYRVAEKFGTLDPRMAGGTQGGLFRRLTGGTANIADVFENITLNTALIVHASLKNVAMRQLFVSIESSPVGQRYAVRIPESTEQRKVAIAQIERVLKEFAKAAADKYHETPEANEATRIEYGQMAMLASRLAKRDPDNGQLTMGDVMSQARFFFTGNPPTIPDKHMVLVKGEPRWFQIGDPMLWDMLTDMNYHQPLGLTEKVFGLAKRTLTRGVTASPEFQIANIIRDTFNAFAMSKGGQIPVVDALKAMRDIWKGSDVFVDFLANGGGFGNATGEEAKRLRVRMKATGRRRLITAVPELLEAWDKWGQSFELATRLAEFKKIRAIKGAEGEPKYTKREAAYQGREISTDFAMRGHSGLARWASISLPFFNARMQGLYRIERELNERRGRQTVLRGERALRYASRAFMGLTMPALLVYWFLNRGDDDYEDLGEELKSLNTVIPMPDGTQLLIPRPFETGALFMELPIRTLQLIETRDGERYADAMMFMFANTFNFNPYPQLIQPPLAISQNRQWNGLPVVPRNLQNVEPREQFQPWTPDTYKRVGEQFNVSPLKLQAIVEGYLGTMGIYAVAASDALMQAPDTVGAEPSRRLSQYPLLRRFMREPPYTNTSFEQRFYDLLDETTRVVDTQRKLRREAREDDLNAYLGDNERAALFAISGPTTDVMELAADLNAQMRAIRSDNTLDSGDKTTQILELQAEQNALFRAAIENFDEALLEQARLELGGQ